VWRISKTCYFAVLVSLCFRLKGPSCLCLAVLCEHTHTHTHTHLTAQGLQGLETPAEEDEFDESQFGHFRSPIDGRANDGKELIELHRVLLGASGQI
jgi:hypothetical protein